MSLKTSALKALTASTLWAAAIANGSSQAQGIDFSCKVGTDNIPTTFAQTPDGVVPVFKWKSTYFRPPYTPMQRCQEVTERMNSFSARGMLEYLTSGSVNRQPVICAGTSCDAKGSNVLVTLKPGQSASQVLEELEANRYGAGGPSYQLSGGSSYLTKQGDGSVTLNLQRYLNSTKPPAQQGPTAPTAAPGVVPSYTPPSNTEPAGSGLPPIW